MRISFNGELVEIQTVPCTPTGWLKSGGIFETLRTVNGLAYAFSRHMVRARISAGKAGVKLPDIELIASAVDELLLAEPSPNGLLRISFDRNGQWAAVHLPYEPIKSFAKVRIHPDVFISHGETIKSYPYTDRLAILEEAQLLGFDEAIVANSEGNICEGAVSNIIFYMDGQWITPPTSDGVLPGIMRGLTIENCGVRVASLALSRINDVTSAILLSSLRIAQPIQSIDGRELELSTSFNTQIHAVAILHSVG